MWNVENTHLDSFKARRLSAIVLFLLGTLILSTAGILYKASELEISNTATVFNRFLIGTLFFGTWHAVSIVRSRFYLKTARDNRNITPLKFFLILLLGLINIVDHLAWSHSFFTTNIAISNILHNLITPFTVLLSWFLLRQTFTKRYLSGAAIAILGSAALVLGDLQLGGNSITGDTEAILSALCTALYLMVSEKLKRDFSVSELLFWVCLITSLGILPSLIVNGQVIFPLSAQGWLIVVLLGLGVQVMGWGLLTYSLNFLSSGIVSIYSLLIPVFAYVEAWIIFSENLTLYQVITSVIVLVGAYISLTSELGASNSGASDSSEREVQLEREVRIENETLPQTSYDTGRV